MTIQNPTKREITLLWTLILLLFLTLLYIRSYNPFNRRFSVADKEISFPYTSVETISFNALLVLAVVFPALFFSFLLLVYKRNVRLYNRYIYGFICTIGFTLYVTELLKIAFGRPRPDFLSRCQPLSNSKDDKFGLSDATICTQHSVDIMLEAFKSFPSGHSSVAFAGMTYLGLFLNETIFLSGYPRTSAPFVLLIPLTIASMVAASRVWDYRHHWQDVLVGSLIGLSSALYFFWSVRSDEKHQKENQNHFLPLDDAAVTAGV